MWGITQRLTVVREAVLGLLFYALLLPGVLAAISTPELVREQQLYSELQRVLCAGDLATGRHDGAPTPLAGCDLCASNCTLGCATPAVVATEVGRHAAPAALVFRLALAEGVVGGTSRYREALPRGPPLRLVI